MQRVTVLLVTIIFLLPAFAETKAHQSNPEQALDIGSRRELFVDHFLIDRLVGTRLELHHPQPAEVAIQVDRPWEGGDNLGISVLHHDGIYRMYYRGMANDDIKGRCLAESRDGITWTKPNLGLIEVAGTRDNNAIVEGKDTWSYFMIPFIDQRPGVPASQRIKGITPGFSRRGNFERRELFLHLSADGARWEKAQDDPILVTTFPNAFDSLVCLFWSAAEQRYILYSRYMVDTQGRPRRKGGLRSVFRSTSPNLIHWSEPTPMTFTGTGVVPSAQLYTSMTEPYFRAPHIYVSFPMRFMEDRKTVSDPEAERIGLRPGRNADSSDGVFMSSRAGSTHFDWIFKEAFLRPGPGWENWGNALQYRPLGTSVHGTRGDVAVGKPPLRHPVLSHSPLPAADRRLRFRPGSVRGGRDADEALPLPGYAARDQLLHFGSRLDSRRHPGFCRKAHPRLRRGAVPRDHRRRDHSGGFLEGWS